MDAGEALTLVDVREQWEYDIAQIAGSKLIPLGELEERLAELPREGILVLQCHSGGRSGQATMLLQEAGFANVLQSRGRDRGVVEGCGSDRAEILAIKERRFTNRRRDVGLESALL